MPRRLAALMASLALFLVGIGAAPAAQAAGLPPTDVKAVPGAGAATVSWDYPADAEVMSFRTVATPVDATLCEPACATQSIRSAPDHRDTIFVNLEAGVPYTISVSAMGTDRAWGPEVVSNVVTPLVKPTWEAPQLSAVGDALELTWKAPDASWPAIKHAYLSADSPSSGAGFLLMPFDITTGHHTFGRDSYAQYNALYKFELTVEFVNGGWLSTGESNQVRYLPAPQPAGTPQLRLTRSGIKVSWVGPTKPTVTSYEVVLQPGNHRTTYTESGPSVTFGGLTHGQKYTATVTSRFFEAPSTVSPTSAPLTYGTAPVAPTTVTATPGLRSVRLAWTPGNGNGIPVTGYSLTCRNRTVVVPGGARAYTFTGLYPGEGIACSVRTLSALAQSTDKATSVRTMAGGLPQKVGSASAKPAKRALMVRWARAYSAGTPITGYEIRTNKGKVYRVPATKTGYTIKKLKKNTKITVQVRARNKWGAGPWSNKTRSTKVM